MREVHRVSGAGVVDVVAFLVRQQAIIACVVDALEGQGWAELVSFRGVVIDHVEDDLDAMGMKLVDHGLELVRERRPEVARLRREEGDRVVTPIIAQPFLDQVAVVDEGMDRQQLCARDAERAQIDRDFRLRQPREGTAVCFGHQRMQLGESLDMHLVDDRPLPRHFGLTRRPPGEGGVDDAAFLHQGRTVAFVKREILVRMIELVAEQFGPPPQLPNQLLGIRIEHELVGIEPVPRVGLVRTMSAVGVDRAGTSGRQIAVPDFVCIFRQLDPLELGLTLLVEQAELDLGGVGREEREVDAEPVPGGAKRKRFALGDPGPAQGRGRARQVIRVPLLVHICPQ